MKKIISIIVAIVLVMSIAITATYASNINVKTTSASNMPEFVVESTSGKVGDTVSVNIMVKNNPGITALQLNVSYSAKDLELVSIENGGLFNDAITHSKLDKNPIIISWYSSSSEDESKNGCLATLKFKILDNAQTNEVCLTYDENNVFDSSFNNIYFNATSGSVKINTGLLGDVNEDGVVSILDAIIIQKHLVGLTNLTDSQKSVADANGDGVVSILDATLIQKYLVGIITTLG